MSATDDVLAPGTRLDGLEIERVLGAGGFGVTYLARDLGLDAWRAVKEYLPQSWGARRRDGTVGPRTGSDAEDYRWGLERFLDEARMLARFRHPHIVQVHRVFEAGGTAYMVMEYVEGRTLASLADAEGPLEEWRVREVLEALTDGLSSVHEAGLLHRDISPDNVMLRPDGAPVLIDFGAARHGLGEHSGALSSVLKPGYAPLEQYPPGRGQGPWTDIYGLGALAYWALSGARPTAATERTRRDPLRPLSEVAARGVSPGLSSAVEAALSVYPEDRPQSLDDWRALLDGGAPPGKRRSSRGGAVGVEGVRTTGGGSGPSRRWWPAAAAAALAAGVLAVALSVPWSGVFSRDEAGPDAAASTAAATPAAAAGPAPGGEARAEVSGEGTAEAPPGDGEASTAAALPPPVAPPGEAGGERREERSGEALRPSPEAVEVQLGLDRSARREIQEVLRAMGFDPGAADGLFGPGTRAALREWQSWLGMPATGYLDPPSVAVLRSARDEAARFEAEFEAEFEAQRQAEVEAQRQAELEAQLWVQSGAAAVFRDCAECPEMVVLPGGGLAMGRYEVTVGEYRAFVSATGGTGDDLWRDHDFFPQTDRHPVAFVSWDDTQEYVSWLSGRTGAAYRLPTEVEWARAAVGSRPGCDRLGRGARPDGTCPVGSYGANAAGLSDMVGNLWERTSDCEEGDCGRRVFRGGSWLGVAGNLEPRGRGSGSAAGIDIGFRVSRTLD